MTLIEAMEKAKDGDILEHKYTIPIGGTFTMWGTIRITGAGKFLCAAWVDRLKFEDIKAENWEIAEKRMPK